MYSRTIGDAPSNRLLKLWVFLLFRFENCKFNLALKIKKSSNKTSQNCKPTYAKWNETINRIHKVAIFVDESLGVESVGVFPVLGRAMYHIEGAQKVGAPRDGVTLDFCVFCTDIG